jgi:hypothetical protein
VRLPTFSRQSNADTDTEERPPVSARTDSHTVTPPPAAPPRAMQRRSNADEDTLVNQPAVDPDLKSRDLRPPADRTAGDRAIGQRPVVAPGPKPRASLLATFGLITAVASALLVLSGPLLGYGIGLAVLALILSLGGISATGKRHIAGKTDALIGMVLALGAIVVGVFALTGSLSWLGTDMHSVTNAREWLDAQFVNRF